MRDRAQILVLQEYGAPTALREAASTLRITPEELRKLLRKFSESAKRLYPSESFIETIGFDRFRFVDISGIIALSPRVRIEVVPKFLEPFSNSWREDFLHIAVLTHNGHLMQNLPVAARSSANANLYDIVGNAWLTLFDKNSRTMMRTYVRTEWTDFEVDGEVDEEHLSLPTEQGFVQMGLKLSRSNPANTLLLKAAKQLLNRVTSLNNTTRLERAIETLKNALKEKTKDHRSLNVFKRDNPWLSLLELSETIVRSDVGFGDFGNAVLPGYILKTDYAWESLMLLSIRNAFPALSVNKRRYQFGERTTAAGLTKAVFISPDISISNNQNQIILLLDSKYKSTQLEPGIFKHISVSDIYEACAYLKVTGVDTLILLYPSRKKIEEHPTQVETFTIDRMKIIAIAIGVEGISKRKGLSKLAAIMQSSLSPFLNCI